LVFETEMQFVFCEVGTEALSMMYMIVTFQMVKRGQVYIQWRTKCAVRLGQAGIKVRVNSRANMAPSRRGKTIQYIETAHARQVTTHM
jgi:hypothetical protein